MAARITEVRNGVVDKITSAWGPTGNDAVIGLTRVDIDSKAVAGRKVYVFRSGYSTTPADRGEDQGDYTVAVMVVERYTGQGDPPETWIDDRVDWCEWLVRLLGDPRGDRLLATAGDPYSGLWPQSAEVTVVHDIEELAEKKLFVSVLSVTYREQVGV